jgi:hypothetical protein
VARAALIAGLSHAIEEGFDVISMSLSIARPEFRARLAQLCDRAYFRRCTMVVAAHNLPTDSELSKTDNPGKALPPHRGGADSVAGVGTTGHPALRSAGALSVR